MDLNILHLSSWKIATNFLDKECHSQFSVCTPTHNHLF